VSTDDLVGGHRATLPKSIIDAVQGYRSAVRESEEAKAVSRANHGLHEIAERTAQADVERASRGAMPASDRAIARFQVDSSRDHHNRGS
jgi:transaldolase